MLTSGRDLGFDETGFSKVMIGKVSNGWIVWFNDDGGGVFKAKYSKTKVFASFDEVLLQIREWFSEDTEDE